MQFWGEDVYGENVKARMVRGHDPPKKFGLQAYLRSILMPSALYSKGVHKGNLCFFTSS